MLNNKNTIGVIGLGYVGLPLALEFGKKTKVVGFDLNKERILELADGKDRNSEVTNAKIKNHKNIEFSYNETKLKNCNIFVVTVPTPVDNKNLPELSLLKKACELVGKYIKKKFNIYFRINCLSRVYRKILCSNFRKDFQIKI